MGITALQTWLLRNYPWIPPLGNNDLPACWGTTSPQTCWGNTPHDPTGDLQSTSGLPAEATLIFALLGIQTLNLPGTTQPLTLLDSAEIPFEQTVAHLL